MDTIGTNKLILLIDVFFVEWSFNIIKYQNGTRKVSLVIRSPLFRGVLYKGILFHFTCYGFNNHFNESYTCTHNYN